MNKNLYNNLNKLYKKRKVDAFIGWLNKKVDDDLLNKDIVNEFITEITISLKKSGYEINNENRFKNEITEYIYLESSNARKL